MEDDRYGDEDEPLEETTAFLEQTNACLEETNQMLALVVDECLEANQQVIELQAELESSERVRESLATILTRTANALHGGPLPSGWWSWHDLPELVARLRAGDDPAWDPRPTAKVLAFVPPSDAPLGDEQQMEAQRDEGDEGERHRDQQEPGADHALDREGEGSVTGQHADESTS